MQNLINQTIGEDEFLATKAKCDLSDKINEILDSEDNGILLGNIQEKTKKIENLNKTDDGFEELYGFKKQ